MIYTVRNTQYGERAMENNIIMEVLHCLQVQGIGWKNLEYRFRQSLKQSAIWVRGLFYFQILQNFNVRRGFSKICPMI